MTLGGVALSQRSARKIQESQAAAASLDRERRNDEALREQADRDHQMAQERAKQEHETQEQEAKREHEVKQGLWKQRCGAYADFATAVDRMLKVGLLAGVGGSGIGEVSAKADRLPAAEHLLYLVATKQTAKVAALFVGSVREIHPKLDAKTQAAKLETVRLSRHLFLKAAREDLGIAGDFLGFTLEKTSEQAARAGQ